MHFTLSTLLLLALSSLTAAEPQLGGGAEVTTTAITQYPTTGYWPSLSTINSDSTTTVYILYTQTFAATALGTWPLGTVVSVGSVGLGSISGTVGGVERRAQATPKPIAAGLGKADVFAGKK